MNNNNLGKGLSELLGSDDFITDLENRKNIKEIDLKFVEPGKYQPRITISDAELQELSASIAEKGVIQPIVVKFNNVLHKYEIIAGERRYRASLLAELTKIPALILDVSDQEAYEIALIENIQRQKLNPLEEALAIEKLVKKYNYTQEEVAEKLGKSRTHITNLLRLLSLPLEVQEMLSTGQLSMGHARALVGQPNAVMLAKQIVDNSLSVRSTEQVVKSKGKKQQKTLSQYDKQKDIYLADIAKNLSKLVGLKVSIKHRNNKGKLSIDFKRNEDIDYILDIFENFARNK